MAATGARDRAIDAGVAESVAEALRALGDPSRLRALSAIATAPTSSSTTSASGSADAVDLRPQVLFVCVADAGRSQLSAALMHRYAGDAVVVRSAGSSPASDVHPTPTRVSPPTP